MYIAAVMLEVRAGMGYLYRLYMTLLTATGIAVAPVTTRLVSTSPVLILRGALAGKMPHLVTTVTFGVLLAA